MGKHRGVNKYWANHLFPFVVFWLIDKYLYIVYLLNHLWNPVSGLSRGVNKPSFAQLNFNSSHEDKSSGLTQACEDP